MGGRPYLVLIATPPEPKFPAQEQARAGGGIVSVGPVSGSGSSDVAALQKQLQADQKAFAADQAAHASDQQLAVDQARVQLDNAAIAAAQSTSGRNTGNGGSGSIVDMYL